MRTEPRPYLQVRLDGDRCVTAVKTWPDGLLGPVDLAVRGDGADGLVVGAGPFSSERVPGANRLVICGESPCWQGFYLASAGGVGTRLRNSGLAAVALSGRAARPSVLSISRSTAGLSPVDLGEVWEEQGTFRFARWLAKRMGGPGFALLCGPAALNTRIGILGSVALDPPAVSRIRSWAGRGGFGSALLQRHNLAAVIFTDAPGDPPQEPVQKRAADTAGVDLTGSVHPLLSQLGTLGANLTVQAQHVLGFNGRTAVDPAAQEAVQRLVTEHYLPQYRRQLSSTRKRSCGDDCTAACRMEHRGAKKDYQPYMALGPNLGVFDQDAARSVVDAADRMGFDAVDGGGLTAWLMELAHDRLLDPGPLGLHERPRFSPVGFDPESDSRANAGVAAAILEACGRGRLPDPFGMNLRAAASALGGEAAQRALYLANGPSGSICPLQFATAGAFAPVALAGKYHTDLTGIETDPVRLGQRCAAQMVLELMYDNLGLCRFQTGLPGEQLAGLLSRDRGQVSARSLLEHHRKLAARIQEQNRAVCWPSRRVRDVVRWSIDADLEAGAGGAGVPSGASGKTDDDTGLQAYWLDLLSGIQSC